MNQNFSSGGTLIIQGVLDAFGLTYIDFAVLDCLRSMCCNDVHSFFLEIEAESQDGKYSRGLRDGRPSLESVTETLSSLSEKGLVAASSKNDTFVIKLRDHEVQLAVPEGAITLTANGYAAWMAMFQAEQRSPLWPLYEDRASDTAVIYYAQPPSYNGRCALSGHFCPRGTSQHGTACDISLHRPFIHPASGTILPFGYTLFCCDVNGNQRVR